ncbi:MAG: deoxyribodipyrimidine photo-lyase [Candidatus Taylorbacteria bacterium]|nr:deoxyribodipyrimidine photo-lyase [Candidatus Taylorbacteria bacterium]
MKSPLVIYWSRRDFRLRDNEALLEAITYSKTKNIPFLPLFILEEYMTQGEEFGYSSQYMIAEAIPSFAKQFTRFAVVHYKGAGYFDLLSKKYNLYIFVNDDVYPDFNTQIKKLERNNIQVHVYKDRVTVKKDTETGSGNLYSVFTPFKNAVWNEFVRSAPLPKADASSCTHISKNEFESLPHSISPTDIKKLCDKEPMVHIGKHTLKIPHKPNLSIWYTNEEDALNHFKSFIKKDGISGYKEKRDSLEEDTVGSGQTSKMSVALAWGFVSARTLVHEIQKHFDDAFEISTQDEEHNEGALCYISELIWREFYGYLLFNHPELMHTEFQKKFRGTISWVKDDIALVRFKAWIMGETGYPIVDAAMKQLAETGWMHNRARMIVASVLTKNFGVDWRWGQEYFRAMLIDLDEASNNGGWQWGASVGADPKPIRIFNAELQAESHDKTGAYREKWLGQDGFMQRPLSAPIIDHKIAREEALERYNLKHVKPRDF